MQNLTQPTLLLKPFAESGDRNTIPVTNTDTSQPNLADLTNGFPQITSLSPDNGGLPPKRMDINGLGYLTTTYDYFYQAGGTFTFNSTISTAIGGYPQGARLWYTDNNGATTVLRSTKENNTDNFVTTPSYIGTSWVAETPVLSWNNTWTGTNTFSGGAISTTASVSDDSTTVATTAYVKDCVPKSVGSSANPVYADSDGVITACDFGMPDYANRVEFTTSTYTPTKNGIIRVRAQGGSPMAEIKIGTFIIARAESTDSSLGTQAVWALVNAGETYTVDYHGATSHQFFFIPFK